MNPTKTSTKTASAFTVIVAFLSISLIGLVLLPLLPVKLAPSRTLPSLTISFSMPNNSARIVEVEATSRLESMLARMRGIKHMSSSSGNGWGNIKIELDKHSSIEASRFEASTIIRQTWPDLAPEVSYPLLSANHPDNKATLPFMTYTLNSVATPIVIQQYAENHIKSLLSNLKGLDKIDIQGATPMEWQLTFDTEQLKTLNISIYDIEQALQQHYSTGFLGLVDVEESQLDARWMRMLLHASGSKTKFDPSHISIKNSKGKLIRLDQVVQVKHTEEQANSFFRINGLNSIYISLRAQEDANQLKLSKQVKELMKEIEAQLPPTYELHQSYDATHYIQNELNKIYLRSGLTLLILLLFVFLFTRNLRYLFLIAVSLFVNLSIAFIFYYFLQLEIQLYSLAGITISLSLIIDNTIIMTDHLMHKENKKAFLPLLAATITTVGALSIIFFLNERIRLNLQDFAIVVIINLLVSLLTALFFVPAMVKKIGLHHKLARSTKNKTYSTRRLSVYATHSYAQLISFIGKQKWIAFVLILLIFGLPTFLLPEKIEQDSSLARQYNKWVSTATFKNNIRPILDKTLGGSLRLFVEKVYRGSYFTNAEEPQLVIVASMPNGTSIQQTNDLITRMESFLSNQQGIHQFQTHISSAKRASITVLFKKADQKTELPYQIKTSIIGKALEIGGGSWDVYGLEDLGFSNHVRESAGKYIIQLNGYNYDELYAWADSVKQHLLNYRRIQEVNINSSARGFKNDYEEYSFELNKELLASKGILPQELFASLAPLHLRNQKVASIPSAEGSTYITLSSKQAQENNMWALLHSKYQTAEHTYQLNELTQLTKTQMPPEIHKKDQEYQLYMQYDYVGSQKQGDKVLKNELERFSNLLPMGYSIKNGSTQWGWNDDDNKQYLLIGLLIIIIFFTTSILFNSIQQPFAVIFIIPISFIGVFLTFYLFGLNFDQGGFASFILLSGITVNASIYILNEYNIIRKQKPYLAALKAYLKAWNSKIMPIFLTVVSTILGFTPFMIGFHKEAFWFPLAAGTIGGLIMSVLGIFIFLPLLILKKKDLRK